MTSNRSSRSTWKSVSACWLVGIDTTPPKVFSSFGYQNGWGGGEEAIRSIQISGEHIRQAAHQVITWIEELGGPLQPEEGIPVNLPAAERSLKER